MKNISESPSGQTEDAPREHPVLQQFRRRLAESGDWPRRFRRLAEAIAQVEDLNCEECQALLDVYVDAELVGQELGDGSQGTGEQGSPGTRGNSGELAGTPLGFSESLRVPTSFSRRMWQHLQTCADCREAHDLLFEALAREWREEPSGYPAIQFPPPRLSFLEPPAPDTPWSVRVRSRLAGAPFGLTFTLTPAYVRALLSSAQPLPARTRGASQSRQPLLLLADSISLSDGQVVVEVVAMPDDRNPGQHHLRATIAGTTTVPENLWVVLKWGDETRAGPVDEQGQADLGEVSLAVLREVLEAEEPICEIAFEERGGEGDAGAPAG